MKQLAQLKMRAQADMERERWCKAVDRAMAELVSMGRMTPRTKERESARTPHRLHGGRIRLGPSGDRTNHCAPPVSPMRSQASPATRLVLRVLDTVPLSCLGRDSADHDTRAPLAKPKRARGSGCRLPCQLRPCARIRKRGELAAFCSGGPFIPRLIAR
jgi:hypothetical protein